MNKSSRLLYLITVILNNPGVSVARMAERCGVSERTIYRDIISISEANIPIYFDNGYHILESASVPPLNFTSDELVYLYNILQSALDSGVLGVVARRLADKLKRHLPGLLGQTHFDFRPRTTDLPDVAKKFEKIEKAINKKAIINIRYTSLNGKTTRRRVHPYGMAFQRHGWYLIGFCEKRADIRLFRLVRISAIRPTPKKFDKPSDFSIGSFLEESWSVFR